MFAVQVTAQLFFVHTPEAEILFLTTSQAHTTVHRGERCHERFAESRADQLILIDLQTNLMTTIVAILSLAFYLAFHANGVSTVRSSSSFRRKCE
jgi:hypothetical protein